MIQRTSPIIILDPPPQGMTASRINLSNQGLYKLGGNFFDANVCHWQPPLFNTIQWHKNRSRHAQKKV